MAVIAVFNLQIKYLNAVNVFVNNKLNKEVFIIYLFRIKYNSDEVF